MTGDIQIFGGIGTERNEVSFDNVKAQLDAIKGATELALHIWTPGGDVMEGEAIYNLLKNTGKPITTYIEGTCASIGSLIALAGDKIVMNETGRFMVHNPKISGLNTQADARDLQHIGMQLDKIKTLLIDVSAKKTGMSKEKLWALYDNETWLTAQEAKAMGFVDEIGPAVKAVAKIDLKHHKMKDESIWKRIQNLFSLTKFKNEFMETLADGRTIIVMSEDEDWTGKQVIYEDGTPLEPGDYTLATGKVISIGEGSVISEVKEAAPANEQPDPNQNPDQQNVPPSPDEMKKIEELTAQLAEMTAAKQALEAQLATQQQQTQQASAKASRFENRMAELEKQFLALKEEASKTIGDQTPPGKGPTIKNIGKDKPQDHMGDFALQFYKNRNVIQHEE